MVGPATGEGIANRTSLDVVMGAAPVVAGVQPDPKAAKAAKSTAIPMLVSM
jgi:hypothetical protein